MKNVSSLESFKTRIMDIITISSDSDESLNDSLKIKDVLQNESINIEWNDDVHPSINHSIELPKNEVVQLIKTEEEIEEFITPLKLNSQSECLNVIKNKVYEYPDEVNISLIESQPLTQSNDSKSTKAKPRQKLSQEEREKEKMLKEQKKLEKEKLKEKRKAEQQKQKALKAVFFENQRNLKPEENIKFLKVHIDNNIVNSVFGGNVISLLQENNIQYVVESHSENFTVTWSKRRVEKVINSFGEVTENFKISDENVLLLALDWEKAVNLIYRNELLSYVETVKSGYFDKKLTLVIYGMEKYFNYKKNKRNYEMQVAVNLKKKSKTKSCETVFEEAPCLARDQLEFALIDLQLIGKHNCRLIETPEEFSALIFNITKSLSQIDIKLERQKRQNNDLGWIGTDSHQCVKVDKNGNGLLRLWQQQICQFSTVGSETAQSIVSQYHSPLALMNEYEKIENIKEGELLLQNIQIRREAGIFSTSRRVGPQLSKKIYKFFTSEDPDLEL